MLNKSGTRDFTIQIMEVLDSAPVPFGNEIDDLSADFVMFCGGIKNDESVNSVRPIPDMFIMSKEEIISAATKNNGNYLLNESEYKLHKDKWEKIGFG